MSIQITQRSTVTFVKLTAPIPAAPRYKACVCGGPLAGIAGSNPAGGVDVSLLWVLCVVRYRFPRRADHSSRGVLPSVVCPSVIDEIHKGGLGPLRLMQTKCLTTKGKRGLLRRKHAPKSQQSLPACCYVLLLLIKLLSQHSIFGHPQPVFFSQCEIPTFTST